MAAGYKARRSEAGSTGTGDRICWSWMILRMMNMSGHQSKEQSWIAGLKKRFLRPVMIIQILSTSEPCSITTACWRILLKTLDTRRLSTGQLYRFHRKQTCGRSGKISSLTCLMKTMRKMHESSLKRTGKRCWLGQKFSGRKSSLTMTWW